VCVREEGGKTGGKSVLARGGEEAYIEGGMYARRLPETPPTVAGSRLNIVRIHRHRIILALFCSYVHRISFYIITIRW
jgi:hypothetical protein